jgi:hypothetical protein
MKSLILSCALPLLATPAVAQDAPPAKDASAENVKKAEPAAWLGIMMQQNDTSVTIGGIVDGSPAAKAGLQSGDVVLGLDKIEVQGDMSRVSQYISERKPGETVALRFRRDDSEKTIDVQLAERPALEGDFRGEFHRAEEFPKKQPSATDKAREEGARALEKAHDEAVKELQSKVAGEDKADDHAKHHGKTGEDKADKDKTGGNGHDRPDKAAREKELRAAKDKLRAAAEAGAAKHKAAREQMQKQLLEFKELQREYGKLFRPGKPDASQPAPLLRWYLDQQWPGDPDKAGRKGSPLLKQTLPHSLNQQHEDAVWKQVEQSVGRALKEAGLEHDVIEKAMQAVAAARKQGPEEDARRAKLEAEAARLEKEMQALKERAGRIREELKKSER